MNRKENIAFSLILVPIPKAFGTELRGFARFYNLIFYCGIAGKKPLKYYILFSVHERLFK